MELNDKYNDNIRFTLDKLKFHQQEELLKLLNQFLENNQISPITKAEKHLHCPHCSSTSYVKNGMRENKQRYKCKKCSLSFTATSNTAIHYTHSDKLNKWVDFVYLMFNSPVPPSLAELSQKLSISTKTAHEWRHKLLASLNELEEVKLRGEIEMDEVFLPFIVKGKKGKEKTQRIKDQEEKMISEKKNTVFLCVHNRESDFDFFPVKLQQKGQISAESIKPIIDKLDIKPDTIVVTDKSKATTSYFKDRTDVTHEVFISNGKKTSILHNNNINNTMSLYKKWNKKFNGHSTKYVWNYLKWFRFHRRFLDGRKLELIVDDSVKDDKSFVRYVLIRKYYEDFLFTA